MITATFEVDHDNDILAKHIAELIASKDGGERAMGRLLTEPRKHSQ